MDRVQVISHIENRIASDGYECLDIEWLTPECVLRVYIDSSNGIRVEDCVKVSKVFDEDALLDVFLPGAYTLEVSSPGIDRPLRTLRHFTEALGKKVCVTYTDLITEDVRNASGVLSEIIEGLTLLISSPRRDITIPLSNVVKANLVGEWN